MLPTVSLFLSDALSQTVRKPKTSDALNFVRLQQLRRIRLLYYYPQCNTLAGYNIEKPVQLRFFFFSHAPTPYNLVTLTPTYPWRHYINRIA